ncbi:MAG: hypothetical protein E7598_01390 [Ruminococcaceae bacterium]|nr:hypothetical protein [Oscillospiraceae bacterium]
MKKLITILLLVLFLTSCEEVVGENTTATHTTTAETTVGETTTAETTVETTAETTEEIVISDIPLESVTLPIHDGVWYTRHRFNDRYVIFLRYTDGIVSSIRNINISVLDLEKREFVYDVPIDTNHSIFNLEYLDGKRVLVASEYDDITGMIVTEENGLFSHTMVNNITDYPFTYEDLASPDGKYSVYQIIEDGDNIGVDVKYPDGRVKRVLTGARDGDLASHRGYGPCEFIDDTRFVYWISGYEWIAGYGIYNVETDERIEVLEGQDPLAFFDGGFFTNTSKDYIVWEIYRHDLNGNNTLIASREKIDGTFTLKEDCYYFYDGGLWFEVQGNPEYIKYNGDDDEAVAYSADFEKCFGKIQNMSGLNKHMFVYDGNIVAIEYKTVEENLIPEVSKERYAQTLTQHIIEHAVSKEFCLPGYDLGNPELFYDFLVSLSLYDEHLGHPYSDMISLSADGNSYEISIQDVHSMNLHTYKIYDWTWNKKYYEEIFDQEKECYRIPKETNIKRTAYTPINIQTYREDGKIFVEFDLAYGYSGFDDKDYTDLGRCYFAFSEEDLIFLDYEFAELPVKDNPYVMCRKDCSNAFITYNFTEDGGMLVCNTHSKGKTEDYYNGDGLLYKSMEYAKNRNFTSKRFYTYDENGLLAKTEEYDASGKLTCKETYIEGKPLYTERLDGWSKWEYNENGLLIKESFHTDEVDAKHTDEVTEYFYDEAGKKIRTVSTYNGHDTVEVDYFYDENGYETHNSYYEQNVCTYYPDGTLKSKRRNSRQVFEFMLDEYLPDGKLWRFSLLESAEFDETKPYEYVQTYSFYDDGRIKGAIKERYDLQSGKYKKEEEVFVSYSCGGRIRKDLYQRFDENGEVEFSSELILTYDKYGRLSTCDTVLAGDMAKLGFHPFSGEYFDYHPMRYIYDEYGRVECWLRGDFVAERYSYMDCTAEQYKLYQKVIANRAQD